MKKIKITAAILSLTLLTACKSGQVPQISETVSETETSAVTTTATTAATAETESETVPETDHAEIAKETKIEYVRVSAGNQFIDFEFIEDYQGVTDIGDLADKAVEFLAEEFIAKKSQWNFLFSEIPETIPDEFADYIDSSGKILPKFQTAYPDDYDSDGRTETFIVLDAPRFEYDVLQSYLVFADSNGNMELVDSFCNPDPVQFLNYGMDKQIIFGGEGIFGVETHSALFGVKYGKSIVHYRLRGSFRKENCFLSSFGFQGIGALMYYDTVMHEYRVIESTDVDIEDIRAMDKTGVFEEYYGEDSPFSAFRLVGGKYYCLIKSQMMDWGEPYIYENDEFIKLENSHMRVSYDMYGLPCVIDINMDKAVANMQPPAEPFVEVSEGNEFIDYDFIENYQGTTDIGDLADKAVEFLKTTEYYYDSMKNISKLKEEGFSNYITDDVIVPKFKIAYPNDYDCDGRTETFIMVDMPYNTGVFNVIRNFLIFADSSGNMEVLSDFSYYDINSAQLLDYGKSKQIVIGSYGVIGADDHTLLFGVANGKVKTLYSGRISFFKSDCFVCTYGWQGSGDFMYFDTAAGEYRAIVGRTMTIDEIKAMDKAMTLKEYYDWYDENGFAVFEIIGEKYYNAALGPMDIGKYYTYENGKFILSNDLVRRSSHDYELKKVISIDIDKAVSEMKKPQT